MFTSLLAGRVSFSDHRLTFNRKSKNEGHRPGVGVICTWCFNLVVTVKHEASIQSLGGERVMTSAYFHSKFIKSIVST